MQGQNRACRGRRILGQQLVERDGAAAGMQALQQRRPRMPRRVVAEVLANACGGVCLLRGRRHVRTAHNELAVAPAMEVALVQVQQPGRPHMHPSGHVPDLQLSASRLAIPSAKQMRCFHWQRMTNEEAPVYKVELLVQGAQALFHNPAAVEPGSIGLGVLPYGLLCQVQLPLRKPLRLNRAGLFLQKQRLVTGRFAGTLWGCWVSGEAEKLHLQRLLQRLPAEVPGGVDLWVLLQQGARQCQRLLVIALGRPPRQYLNAQA